MKTTSITKCSACGRELQVSDVVEVAYKIYEGGSIIVGFRHIKCPEGEGVKKNE